MIKKTIASIMFIAFASTLALAKPPVSKKDMIASLKKDLTYSRAYQGKRIKKFNKIQLSNNERYTTKERNYLQYPYYIHDCYVYWTGTYGQTVKEYVTIYYIKTGGEWIYDGSWWNHKKFTQVKRPTSLPKRPGEPEKVLVLQMLEKELKGIANKVKIMELNLKPNPKFDWRGPDYDYAAYIYDAGDIKYETIYSKYSIIGISKGTKVEIIQNLKTKEWSIRVIRKQYVKLKEKRAGGCIF